MQGIVYGSAIHLAKPFEGVKVWIQSQREQKNKVYIVSHRTRYPIIGEKIDLHLAARNWICNQKIQVDGAFFFESRADKIKTIGELKCDIFFDDLKEVLEDEYFPVNTKKVLFYPDSVNSEKVEGFLIHSHWGDCDFRF